VSCSLGARQQREAFGNAAIQKCTVRVTILPGGDIGKRTRD
jgi:hypothetical protein